MVKRFKIIMLLIAMTLTVTACGSGVSEGSAEAEKKAEISTEDADISQADQELQHYEDVERPGDTAEIVDLTAMSSTMVYSYVFDMISNPDSYLGRTVKLEGEFYSEYYEPTNLTYNFAIIADATACCAQGMEFVFPEGAEIPEVGTNVEVIGTFEQYFEGPYKYFHIIADSVVY